MIQNKHLKETEYKKIAFKKRAIVLHFTAGWPDPYQTINIWDRDNERKGTAYVIGGIDANGGKQWDGVVVEAFDSSYTAYHLFRWFNGSEAIENATIGIELCNWGPITKRGDLFYTYVNTVIPADQVCELETPWRGYKYWHKFSDAQLASLKTLLLMLMEKHEIPAHGIPQMLRGENTKQLQRILNGCLEDRKMPLLVVDGIAGPKTNAALKLFPHAPFDLDPSFKDINNVMAGVYAHCTFDGKRKLDVQPQPELITLLKSLY